MITMVQWNPNEIHNAKWLNRSLKMTNRAIHNQPFLSIRYLRWAWRSAWMNLYLGVVMLYQGGIRFAAAGFTLFSFFRRLVAGYKGWQASILADSMWNRTPVFMWNSINMLATWSLPECENHMIMLINLWTLIFNFIHLRGFVYARTKTSGQIYAIYHFNE